MNGQTVAQQQKSSTATTRVHCNMLQRKCACGQHTMAGGECAACRQKRRPLQRRATNQAEPSTVPPIVYEVLRSPGRALDPATRAYMESRFRHDFSRVRVHTDTRAAESARTVNALAYTVGQEIVFGQGQYAPSTTESQRLLAHELTHVVQQSQTESTFGQAATTFARDNPSEHAARENAELATLQSPAEIVVPDRSPGRLPMVQRATDENAVAKKASCAWRTIEEAKEKIKIKVELLPFLLDSIAALNDLFIALKQARTCFPEFNEAAFLALTSERVLLTDELRRGIASGHRANVRKDDRRLIWAESHKPFAGYAVSGFEAARRFTGKTQRRRLGGRLTSGHRSATEFAKEPAATAETSFRVADILVFSGHQYAQYKAPGVWMDSKGTGWDIREISGPINNVKLIVSTSCATICQEAYNVWKPLFPNAVVLGYKRSAPLAGGKVASTFAKKLPQDLILDAGGVSQAIAAWKATVSARHKGNRGVQPGWLEVRSGRMEYWNGRTWVSLQADSDENKCRVKGDYSADWPDPRAATPSP